MEGYKIGETPPELAEDGSFKTPLGARASAIVDEAGRILVVDQETKCLISEDDDE